MRIAFDPVKNETNQGARGCGFGYAARIFLGRTLLSAARISEGEARLKAIGEVEGRIYVVIFVDHENVRRIISARPASREERKEWLAQG